MAMSSTTSRIEQVPSASPHAILVQPSVSMQGAFHTPGGPGSAYAFHQRQFYNQHALHWSSSSVAPPHQPFHFQPVFDQSSHHALYQQEWLAILYRLKQQVEFYFSLENLCRDDYLIKQMMLNQGSVPCHIVGSFPRVLRIVGGSPASPQLLGRALSTSSIVRVYGEFLCPLTNILQIILQSKASKVHTSQIASDGTTHHSSSTASESRSSTASPPPTSSDSAAVQPEIKQNPVVQVKESKGATPASASESVSENDSNPLCDSELSTSPAFTASCGSPMGEALDVLCPESAVLVEERKDEASPASVITPQPTSSSENNTQYKQYDAKDIERFRQATGRNDFHHSYRKKTFPKKKRHPQDITSSSVPKDRLQNQNHRSRSISKSWRSHKQSNRKTPVPYGHSSTVTSEGNGHSNVLHEMQSLNLNDGIK